MDDKSMYGKKLVDYAVALGLSQSEIANHLGIHRAHVHRWLHGVRPVPDHYRSQLFGLIAKTFPRYMARFQARLQGTNAERRKAFEDRMHRLDQLGELIAELQVENALENATRALEALKALPLDALHSRANAPAIADCATALLTYANVFAACGPLADFVQEVEREYDLVRELAEPGDDGQGSAVNQ
jgi:transcriptional regulator with XRE-family HTH domain